MISAVVASSLNGVIGKDGVLPWHVPSDLNWFKEVTMGKPIIMGRKTWDGLPKRPLPGRLNIVISRNHELRLPGAIVCPDADSALQAASVEKASEICIIGGGEIYRMFWPRVQRIYLSRIQEQVSGDTFLPQVSFVEWEESKRTMHPRGPNDSASFETVIYTRR